MFPLLVPESSDLVPGPAAHFVHVSTVHLSALVDDRI